MSLAQIYYSDWLILFCCINDNLVAKYAYKYIRKGECTPSNSKSLTISTKSYRYHAILILFRFENISKGLAIFGRNTPLYLIHSILKQAGALAFIFNHDMH